MKNSPPAASATLNDREHATIVAALRYYQNDLDAHRLSPDVDPQGEIDLIATSGDSLTGLDAGEIDELVDRLREKIDVF